MLRRLAPFAADLWTHRELLWQFTMRNVELRHKGSHLGLAWSFLSPLLMLGLYWFVFGYLNENKFGVLEHEPPVYFALGLFLGLTFYHLVAETLSVSPGLIVANPNFVKKVVFPLEILPAANVGAAVFHMLISMSLVLIGLLVFGDDLGWGVLWLPVIILPLIFLCLGIAWFFSALGVFFRDVGQIMQFLTMVLMFTSAVFYSAQSIMTKPNTWVWMRFNPMLLAIELGRDAALWQRPLNFHHLAYLYAVSLFACYLGHLTFRRMKPAFADVL